MEIWLKDETAKRLVNDSIARGIVRQEVWRRIGNASVASVEKESEHDVLRVEAVKSHFHLDFDLDFTLLPLDGGRAE